jgi:hypothetical protein
LAVSTNFHRNSIAVLSIAYIVAASAPFGFVDAAGEHVVDHQLAEARTHPPARSEPRSSASNSAAISGPFEKFSKISADNN